MNILDRRFKYTPSDQTNLRKTFARVRREQARAHEASAEAKKKIAPLRANRSAKA